MIQKQSILIPNDKSGVWLGRTIHTYTKLSRLLVVNGFGKVSIVATSPSFITFRKKKRKILYTRQTTNNGRRCGLTYTTYKSALFLKKRLTPIGRRVTGFVSKNILRKRAISSFVKIL